MKKLLALVLALVMTLGLATVGANAALKDFPDANSVTYEEAMAVMNAVGVFTGKDGKLAPTDKLTRAEASKLIAYLALGEKTAEALPSVQVFTDVPATHWAAKYIAYGKNSGIIGGVNATKTLDSIRLATAAGNAFTPTNFVSGTTEYTVAAPFTATDVVVTATATDDKATIFVFAEDSSFTDLSGKTFVEAEALSQVIKGENGTVEMTKEQKVELAKGTAKYVSVLVYSEARDNAPTVYKFTITRSSTAAQVTVYSGGGIFGGSDATTESKQVDLTDECKIDSFTIAKAGSTLLGWYDNADLTGDPLDLTTKTFVGGESIYPKWSTGYSIEVTADQDVTASYDATSGKFLVSAPMNTTVEKIVIKGPSDGSIMTTLSGLTEGNKVTAILFPSDTANTDSTTTGVKQTDAYAKTISVAADAQDSGTKIATITPNDLAAKAAKMGKVGFFSAAGDSQKLNDALLILEVTGDAVPTLTFNFSSGAEDRMVRLSANDTTGSLSVSRGAVIEDVTIRALKTAPIVANLLEAQKAALIAQGKQSEAAALGDTNTIANTYTGRYAKDGKAGDSDVTWLANDAYGTVAVKEEGDIYTITIGGIDTTQGTAWYPGTVKYYLNPKAAGTDLALSDLTALTPIFTLTVEGTADPEANATSMTVGELNYLLAQAVEDATVELKKVTSVTKALSDADDTVSIPSGKTLTFDQAVNIDADVEVALNATLRFKENSTIAGSLTLKRGKSDSKYSALQTANAESVDGWGDGANAVLTVADDATLTVNGLAYDGQYAIPDPTNNPINGHYGPAAVAVAAAYRTVTLDASKATDVDGFTSDEYTNRDLAVKRLTIADVPKLAVKMGWIDEMGRVHNNSDAGVPNEAKIGEGDGLLKKYSNGSSHMGFFYVEEANAIKVLTDLAKEVYSDVAEEGAKLYYWNGSQATEIEGEGGWDLALMTRTNPMSLPIYYAANADGLNSESIKLIVQFYAAPLD